MVGKTGPARQEIRNIAGGMTHLASKRSEMMKIGYSVEDLKRLRKTASTLEKSAGRLSGMKPREAMLWAVGLTGAGAALGVGQHAAVMGINKVHELGRKAGRGKEYDKMLRADPTLRREPEAKKFFDIVHRASPYIASEPVIAAATVRSMIDSPMLDERKFKQIMELEKMHQETKFPLLVGNRMPEARGLGILD